MVQPLMPFSPSAALDLNPAAFQGMHLPELHNRQVAFAGFESLQLPLQTRELSALSRFPGSVCLFFPLFKSHQSLFWPLLSEKWSYSICLHILPGINADEHL